MKKIIFAFAIILTQISFSQASEQNQVCNSGYIFKYLQDTPQGKVVNSPIYKVQAKFDELCESEVIYDDSEIVEKLNQYCNLEVDNWVEGNSYMALMRAIAKGTSKDEEKSRLKQFGSALCVNLKIAMSVFMKENGVSEI